MAKKLNNFGQTVIESVFVVGIMGLILSGLVAGVIYSNRVSRVSRDKTTALKIAKEKMEDLKASNQTSFWANASSIGVGIGSTDPGDISTITISGASFTRRVSYSDYTLFPSTQKVQVKVIVSWQDGSQNKEVVVNRLFVDY